MKRMRCLTGTVVAALILGVGVDVASPGRDAERGDRTDGNPEWAEPDQIAPKNNITFADLTVRLTRNRVGQTRLLHRSYNGSLIGPVIRTKPGGELIVHLRNKLPVEAIDAGPPADMTPPKAAEVPPPVPPNAHWVQFPHGYNTTNLHTHGLHVSPEDPSDNVFLEIDPWVNKEATYKFQIPSNHTAGTFWYHAHKHGSVGYQLSSGMAGALIVAGGLDDYQGLRSVSERIMVFQQIPYRIVSGRDAQIFPQDVYSSSDFAKPRVPAGAPKPVRATLINGQTVPVLRMRPGEVRRFRMIHAGIETSIYVHLEGHDFYEIALDGIPLKELRKQAYIDLEPGYRSDALVRASSKPGTYLLYNEVPPEKAPNAIRQAAVAKTTLAKVIVSGDPAMGPDISSDHFKTDLRDWATDYLKKQVGLEDIDPKEITGKRCLTMIHDGAKVFYIDGRHFDAGRIDQKIKLGDVEEWTIESLKDNHPFHIHVNPFQVEEEYPDGKKRWVWRDTYLIREGQTAKIRSRFRDFPGKSVLHCHNLDHEDLGMMQAIQFVQPGGEAGAPGAETRRPRTGWLESPRQAPDWELEDVDGRQRSFGEFKGRRTLLVLHRGMECFHCAQQILSLARSADSFRSLGVDIVALSPRWPDAEAVRAVRDQLKIDFPLVADPRLEVFRALGCLDGRVLHGAFLVNAAGRVEWQTIGEAPERDMSILLGAARASRDQERK